MDRIGIKGRWIAQAMPLLVLGALLGYYFGIHVPERRNYFKQRNLRALAIVGDQFKSSIETFPKALDIAARSLERSNNTNISELKATVGEAMGLLRRLHLFDLSVAEADETTQSNETAFYTTNRQGKAWLRVQRKGFAGSNTHLSVTIDAGCELQQLLGQSPEFDGLVLVKSDGTVLVDNLPAGWRLVRLDALQNIEHQPVASNLLTGVSRAVQVELGPESYWLFSHPLPMALNIDGRTSTEWLLCGLVDADRFEADARAVADVYWSLGMYLALLALLSGPFCKFFFSNPRERLTRWNVRWLVVNGVALAAVMILALAGWTTYGRWEEQAKEELRNFGEALATNLQDELLTLYDQLVRIQSSTSSSPAGPTNLVVDLLTQANFLPADGLSHPYFHTVSWLNQEGRQMRKWTTRPRSTPFLDLKERNYFRDALENKPSDYAWRGKRTNFWLEPIYAYYSGENSFVLSVHPTSNVVMTIDAPLISVAAPVLPPGFGFCVVAGDGRVLIHSEPHRSLHENLFEECAGDRNLVRLVATRTSEHIEDIEYLGRVHSFNVRPLPHTSWSLVVFREEGPLSAVNFHITIVSLVLLAGWLLGVGVFLLLVWGVLWLARELGLPGFRKRWPEPKRALWGMLLPNHEGRSAYVAVTLLNLAVAIGTLVWVLTTDSTVSMAWAAVCGALLGLWGVGFGLISRAGLKITTWIGDLIRARIRLARGSRTSRQTREIAAPDGYGRSLVSLLLLLAVIPALACLRIAHELGARYYLQDGLRQIANDLTLRQERVDAEYQGFKLPADFLDNRKALTEGPDGHRVWDVYIEHFFNTRVGSETATNCPADLFDHIFHLVGSDTGAPMLLAAAADDGAWQLGLDDKNLVSLTQGSYQLIAETQRFLKHWETWEVLLGVLGISLLVYLLTRFIVRRIMLVHAKGQSPVNLAEFLQRGDTCHLLVLDDAVGAEQGKLLDRLDDGCQAALRKASQQGSLFVHDLRQGLPPEELIRKHGGLVVLDHFEHRWNDRSFNRKRSSWIERVLTQGGPTLVLISTLHPDHFSVAEPEAQVAEKGPRRLEEPATARPWLDAFRIAYLHPPMPQSASTPLQQEARYRSLWATCSKDEQLALAHLAKDGLIQPRNRELGPLLGRGLVVSRPRVQLFEEGFSRYAFDAGEGFALRAHEQKTVHSAWASMRVPLLLLLVGLFVILNLAQPHLYTAVVSMLPVLAIVGPAVQRVKGLLALVRGDSATANV